MKKKSVGIVEVCYWGGIVLHGTKKLFKETYFVVVLLLIKVGLSVCQDQSKIWEKNVKGLIKAKTVKTFENVCWLVIVYLQFSVKIIHSGCCFFC